MAKGFSSAEFKDVLTHFREHAYEVMERACDWDQALISKRKPIFSYDNWSGHKAASQKLGLVEGDEQRAPVPPRSHDIHKVIEHCFNTTAYKFGNKLWLAARDDDPQVYMDIVEDIMFNEVTVKSVQLDVLSLFATYHDILSKDGDWADKANR